MMPTDGRGAWRKFICIACGFIYDEELGDVDGGLPAGTRFEDIPDDWQCPLCGVRKTDFEPYEQTDDETVAIVEFDNQQAGVVIVGAGLAGWAMVDAIRAVDKDIPVTLISADDADRYHKPMLSVAISQHKTPSDLVRSRGAEAAITANVRLLANTFVTNIDTDAKRLHTTLGNIAYDDLVLAIGAKPAYPPTIDPSMAWHVNHLDKFAGLQARLSGDKKHIAIIGAGMIGAELAEDLTMAGHRVSLIDVHPRPLNALLPKIATEQILDAITGLGVLFLGQSMVQSVQKNDAGYVLELLDCTNNQTTQHQFDEIVVSTGLMVDDRLPVRAGLDFDKRTGIKVDTTTLQTNVPHIYALGDCISIDGMPCRYVAPHRPQATAIANHILQGVGNYEHKPPMIRLKNKSISVTANGYPTADGDWQIITQTEHELSLELHQDGQLLAKALLKKPIG
ncbi:FAD-dependent oxidoreductase [Moraxella sp.]|uniref:FAD-dependent oxidoreductase n=1 Tax=Moraxella sp. TaxID=479 RepID=UPI0026DC97EE|nr:FAD-dependent oxidoreductase [Moraxella sp.]MDO4895079.1 FAD-dependent oxidoreductase [Moraxella sp.]